MTERSRSGRAPASQATLRTDRPTEQVELTADELEDDHDPFGWVGETIADKYTVESVVGEGGFGVVYRAKHKGLAELVAIKCLKVPEGVSADQKKAFLETFLAEGRILHQISRATADVVQALDVGEATSPDGTWTPYMVLEWVDGASLADLIEDRIDTGKGGYSLAEAVKLLTPAARALAVAHQQGVAHRDIKPTNLLLAVVGGRSTLKIVDFGIAKALAGPQMAALRRRDSAHSHSDFATTTPDGDDVDPFTPRYGAPEQFSKKYGTTGPWTDVFALALVLVETCIAAHALEGDEPGQYYVASADLLHRPTPRAKGVTTTDDVEQVLLRALAVDPKRRYQNAGEFWDALVAVIPEVGGDRAKSVKPPPSVDAHGIVAEAERRKESQRQRALMGRIGLGLALLASAGACAFLWLGPSSDPNAEARAAALASASAAARTNASLPMFAQDAAAKIPDAPDGMVYVAPATFTMGSDQNEANEKPAHKVTISKGFFLDKTEVRAGEYAVCVRAGGCTKNHLKIGEKEIFSGCNQGDDLETSRHPVNCIDQDQATSYCKSVGKRLPTEAEWELAARGTDGRMYPWGNARPTTCWMAIVGGVSGACARKGTWEVGTTADGRSPVGAFDMAGNVWEWVGDGYETYPKSDVTDPFVPATGSRGVLRGGSWDYSANSARTTSRLPLSRASAQISTGFRCAKDVP